MNIPTETLIEKRDQMAKKDPLAHCDDGGRIDRAQALGIGERT